MVPCFGSAGPGHAREQVEPHDVDNHELLGCSHAPNEVKVRALGVWRVRRQHRRSQLTDDGNDGIEVSFPIVCSSSEYLFSVRMSTVRDNHREIVGQASYLEANEKNPCYDDLDPSFSADLELVASIAAEHFL